mmetsp:Transcript_14784/g.29151  ORF Transcript_14784/g.29151 Transcript_14784/m.29151 type:complete len:341 (+) Transcript_14784:52-1074(+)
MTIHVVDGNDSALAVSGKSRGSRPLPQLKEAKALFSKHLPCEAPQLRRVYLQLALQFHPDKRPKEERVSATQLFQAIAAAYEELLKDSDPKGTEQPGQRVKSPVAAAAELGDLQELRRLLEERPESACEADDLGVFPLMFAAAGGSIEAVELLLEFGADVHAKNPIKWSVLLYAALGNHGGMVRFLVERGSVVTTHELILAAYTGNPESFEALIDLYEGSVADLRMECQRTLLHMACDGLCFLRHSAQRHMECISLAIRAGVPLDAARTEKQRTCLQDFVADVRWQSRAFENSATHLEALEMLCMAGASPTAEDSDGSSALSLAAEASLRRVRGALMAYA